MLRRQSGEVTPVKDTSGQKLGGQYTPWTFSHMLPSRLPHIPLVDSLLPHLRCVAGVPSTSGRMPAPPPCSLWPLLPSPRLQPLRSCYAQVQTGSSWLSG